MNLNPNLNPKNTFIILGIVTFAVPVGLMVYFDAGDGGATVLAMIAVPIIAIFSAVFSIAGYYAFRDKNVSSAKNDHTEKIESSKNNQGKRIIKFLGVLFCIYVVLTLLGIIIGM